MLTPATIGILATSASADRFARRHSQRWLIIVGFAAAVAGMILLLALVRAGTGLSRSISNLGSSLGTALVGAVLVAATLPGGRPFGVALTVLAVFTLVGLVIAVLLPPGSARPLAACRLARSAQVPQEGQPRSR